MNRAVQILATTDKANPNYRFAPFARRVEAYPNAFSGGVGFD